MAAAESKITERVRAAFVAAAVGDALGWPMEDRGNRVGGTAKVEPAPHMVAWVRREGGRYAPHEQPISAGSYSDDTQLLLAVARSRLRGDDWHRHLVEAELPVWLLYERGGGGALKRSARSWAYGKPPWDSSHKEKVVASYFQAGGNGAAMRCAPHVLVDREARSFASICDHLDADGLATHGHPRALVGSRLFAWALWWALGRRERLGFGELLERAREAAAVWSRPPIGGGDWGEAQRRAAPDWREDWRRAVGEALRYLEIAGRGIGRGAISMDARTLEEIGLYGRERGAGTVSAVAAIYLASRYTSQPLQGLLAAAFLRNTDSDTVASMTAALLGCLAGGDWLGGLGHEVQDRDYLGRVAGWLAGEEAPRELPSLRWEMPMRTRLYRRLDQAKEGERLELPLFGPARVRAVHDHAGSAPASIRSWDLETQLGQTLQIKRSERGKDGAPRWRPLPHPPGQEDPPTDDKKRRRAGLVREVADLEVACRFYEDVVGLVRERASRNFVSFGWLALERAEENAPEPQLSIDGPDELEDSRQMIRVYLDIDELVDRRRKLQAQGLPVGKMSDGDGATRFLCADPDGYVVEFRGRD